MSYDTVCCALVCLRTGKVLEMLEGVCEPRIVDLASAGSALLCDTAPAPLVSAFARCGSDRAGRSFDELAFVSETGAHVLLRIDCEHAIVAVSPNPESLGAVLSATRARRIARGGPR